jgi:hypothetical protein
MEGGDEKRKLPRNEDLVRTLRFDKTRPQSVLDEERSDEAPQGAQHPKGVVIHPSLSTTTQGFKLVRHRVEFFLWNSTNTWYYKKGVFFKEIWSHG